MPPRIWNLRRQWLGNLIPLAVAILVGLTFYRFGVIVQCLSAIAVAWICVNQWGFFENSKIDAELRKKTAAEGELIGFVHLKPPTALDAHAEIGLLQLKQTSLEINTEDEKIQIKKQDIASITRSRNIHSILFLGGWVVLTLTDGTKLQLESRQFPTMFRSKLQTNKLAETMKTWKK